MEKARTPKRGTTKQRKLAKVIVENAFVDKPMNSGEMLEKVGYSETTANHKQRDILESDGVKTELAILGFDVQTAKEVVGEILKDKSVEPQHRLKAAGEIFKVNGTYAAEKSISVQYQIPIENRQYVESVAQKAIEEMKHGENNS